MGKLTDTTPIWFGIYKGATLANVPAKYLMFLYDNRETNGLSDDLKAYILDNFAILQQEIRRESKNAR